VTSPPLDYQEFALCKSKWRVLHNKQLQRLSKAHGAPETSVVDKITAAAAVLPVTKSLCNAHAMQCKTNLTLGSRLYEGAWLDCRFLIAVLFALLPSRASGHCMSPGNQSQSDLPWQQDMAAFITDCKLRAPQHLQCCPGSLVLNVNLSEALVTWTFCQTQCGTQPACQRH